MRIVIGIVIGLIAIVGVVFVVGLILPREHRAASRIVLPSRPAMVLLSLALVPAAPALGLSPWVVGFVVLVASNVWVLPYQGLEYLIARDATKGEAFDDRQGTRVGAALTAVRFAAIAVAVPVWVSMGLIQP